jgi:hypothetical protein
MSFIDNIRKTTGQIGDIVKKTYGPLAPLENRYDRSVYRYPLDVGNSQRYPHTVEFQTWLPESVPITDMGVVQATQDNVLKPLDNKLGNWGTKIASGAGQVLNSVTGGISNVTGGFFPPSNIPVAKDGPYGPAPEEWEANDMKVTRNKKYNDRMMDFTRRASRSDLITMYLPQGTWNDRINNAYNQQSMTQALGAAGAIVEVGSSIIKEYDGWGKEGGEGFWSKAGDMMNGPAGMEAVAKASGALGMDSGVVRDAGLTALGYALNPQFEMLYSGTDLREFQFDFTMTPRSEKEAIMIRDIVRKFKYHASPAYVSGQGRYIGPPSYFDITFKFNGADSEWLPQISTCVLKSFDIDYTGGLEQWATHADGSPIQIRMVMIFAELEMMHKTLREQGY